jgi:putative transposase
MAPDAKAQVQDETTHNVITRGNNKMQVFHDSSDFKRYLKLFKRYQELYPVKIYHYCLMPNHTHFLIYVPESRMLRKLMQGVSQSYSNYYRQKYDHSGHLWQGRYKSFPIEEDSYLLECGRYIERNPVRARLVKNVGEWSWSSYKFYASGKVDSLLTPTLLYHDLGNTEVQRQAAYKKHLQQEQPYESLVDKHFVPA